MAVTENTYTGNGSTVSYAITFPYLKTTDIEVTLNGVVTTAYTFASPSVIQFNTAPGAGVPIGIYRRTNNDTAAATFFSGSSIRAIDLNDNFTQILYAVQEIFNRTLTTVGATMAGILNMAGYRITNLGTPTASTDAATKGYIDGVAFAAGNLTVGDKGDITVNSASSWTIDNSAITDAKVSATAAIQGTKISPSFGTQTVTTSGIVQATNQGELRLVEPDGLGNNYVALKAPATLASNTTWILPSADGSSGQFLRTNGTGTLSFLDPLANAGDGTVALPSLAFSADTNTGIYRVGADTLGITAGGTKIFEVNTLGVSGSLRRGTAITTTSGVSAGFTGIPSWARRITFILNGVSSNGNNALYLQIGTSTGYVTSGYTAAAGPDAATVGVPMTKGAASASNIYRGFVSFINITGNVWIMSGTVYTSNEALAIAGSVDAGGVVDRIQVTTFSIDTLDAGSVNIIYEG